MFCWSPACAEGGTTRLITVWASDSGSPPQSNSVAFAVTVSDCVELSIGSSVQQTGLSVCVPVTVFSTIGLTNLTFILSEPAGGFTNWSLTSTNYLIDSALVQTVDPSRTLFNIGVQSGRTLLGSNGIGSVCFDIPPGPSAFVPLALSNIGANFSVGAATPDFLAQNGRMVVIGGQSLLDASIGAGSIRILTLYGKSGATYDLLSSTNADGQNSWRRVGSASLTNLFEVINLGGATNEIEFFKAMEP